MCYVRLCVYSVLCPGIDIQIQSMLGETVERIPKVEQVNLTGGRLIREAKVCRIFACRVVPFFVPFSPPINTQRERERERQWEHTPLSLFKSFQHLYPGCNLQKCKKLFFLLCDTRPPWCILCLCAAKCEYLHVRPTVFFTLSLSFVAIQSVFRCFELTVFFLLLVKGYGFFIVLRHKVELCLVKREQQACPRVLYSLVGDDILFYVGLERKGKLSPVHSAVIILPQYLCVRRHYVGERDRKRLCAFEYVWVRVLMNVPRAVRTDPQQGYSRKILLA